MERRLAAVLIADVAGYVRLSEADEEGARARFQADLHSILGPAIAGHHGRLVKTMGDALLVEFHSVVDALRCAIEVQREKIGQNAAVPEAARFVYRIGINLGDVIVEGDDIHGDGVNIASRLQELADPGGIAISGTVYDQVRTKAEAGYAYLGEQRVKNAAAPIRVYRVLLDPTSAGKTIATGNKIWRSWRWPVAAAVVVAVVVSIILALMVPWEPAFPAASIEDMKFPLPEKPSVAVMPFANLSGDAAQNFYADGITDDLGTELAKISSLFVIAGNSMLVYKDEPPPPKKVSEDLGVRFVLTGSVQRAGDELRINARLVDALTGYSIWADDYDGSLTDVFALQDEVTRSVADALAVKLAAEETLAVDQRETSEPAAYDAFLKGWIHYRRTTPEDFIQAIPNFEQAVRLDPEFSRAYAALAIVYARLYEKYWNDRMGLTQLDVRDRAFRYLKEAKKRPTTLSYQAAGILIWVDGAEPRRAEEGAEEMKKAIALNSNDPLSYAYLALMLIAAGKPAEAMPHIRTAMRLDPYSPTDYTYFHGLAQLGLEQYAAAAESFKSVTKARPHDAFPFVALAVAYGHLGLKDEAASTITQINHLEVSKGYRPIDLVDHPWLGFRDYKDVNRVREGLILAGVPSTLAESEFAEQNGLTEMEIRNLLFGHRLYGRTIQASLDHSALITPDGVVTATGDWGTIKEGIGRFDDGKFCIEQSEYLTTCAMILRNPGGTKALGNEYLWIQRGREFLFSVVD